MNLVYIIQVKGDKKPFYLTNDLNKVLTDFYEDPKSGWSVNFKSEVLFNGFAIKNRGGSERKVFIMCVGFSYITLKLYAYRWVLGVKHTNIPSAEELIAGCDLIKDQMYYSL